MIKSEILVPLLNTNEPEARLVGIHVRDGQAVEKGAPLFTIETTKAAAEIESPGSGFVRLLATEGDLLAVGARLAVIADTADEPLQFEPVAPPAASVGPSGLRITAPARRLAESLGVVLSKLPSDRLVTEEIVRGAAGVGTTQVSLPKSDRPYLLIFGGGGHAKTLIDMLIKLDAFAIAGIVDDNLAAGKRVLGIPVLGGRAVFPELLRQDVKLAANAVGGILDIGVRVRVFEALQAAGFSFPPLVHPRATLEASAKVGQGVQVFANAYVGSDAVLHPKCMVNTNAVVSHDCEIGEYTHIAPGALLAGQVRVGERTLVGMGVTVHIGVKIGSGARIGNGAILLSDVPDKMVIQAGRFWVGKAG